MRKAYADQMNASAPRPSNASCSDLVAAIPVRLVWIGLILLMGCATGDLNARRACKNTGHVDVYANLQPTASWEVERFDISAGKFRHFISDFDPSTDSILRLALAPGSHRLRLTCLNRVTTGPTEIEVRVEKGKVTPVCVTFDEAGTALVEEKPLILGHFVPFKDMRFEGEEPMYHMCATAAAPLPYQPKSQMPYARQRTGEKPQYSQEREH